jgi:hypothetical protein
MQTRNYTATLEVAKTPQEAFNGINSVSKWWSENIAGNSANLNDVFTIHFGADTFVTHKIIEVVPDKKVVWEVTDCYLPWLKDKTEWTNTRMVFDISSENNLTTIHFTHVGLVPEVECYESCVKGWDQYVKGSLLSLLTEGKGQPQKKVG